MSQSDINVDDINIDEVVATVRDPKKRQAVLNACRDYYNLGHEVLLSLDDETRRQTCIQFAVQCLSLRAQNIDRDKISEMLYKIGIGIGATHHTKTQKP